LATHAISVSNKCRRIVEHGHKRWVLKPESIGAHANLASTTSALAGYRLDVQDLAAEFGAF
jgi:hypothetical protein